MEHGMDGIPAAKRSERRPFVGDATRFRRTMMGACLIVGPAIAVAGGLATPWESEATVASYLQALGENPIQAQASAILLYFGYLLTAVGIFGMIHVVKERAVVLAHVAGIFAVWGWISLPGLLVTDFYDLSLAQFDDRQAAVAISERAGEYAGSAVLGMPVLFGFIGLAVLVFALWRAGFAPVWVPLVFLAGFAMSFFGPVGVVSFTVGFALALVSLGYVGMKILRMSDEEWERGGNSPGAVRG
ncbi:MAG: hypothetical protein ACRDSJ_23480 [Rubrobacteraceae bacterium]